MKHPLQTWISFIFENRMKITTINSTASIFLLFYLKKCFAISYCSVPIWLSIFCSLFWYATSKPVSLCLFFRPHLRFILLMIIYYTLSPSLVFFKFLFSSISIFFYILRFLSHTFSLSSSPFLFSVSRENTENVGFSVRHSKYSMFRKFRRSSRYYTLILIRKTQRSHNTQNKGE